VTAPTLWIEITIAGAVYVAAICFAWLGWLRAKDLLAVVGDKDLLPYLSAMAVAVSYVVGMLTHRLTAIVGRPVLKHLERVATIPRLFDPTPREVHFADMVSVWQRGSARLHRELDFQFALVALLRSLLFSVPTLTISVIFWLARTQQAGQWSAASGAVVLWSMVLVAYHRQWVQYRAIRRAAIEEIARGHGVLGKEEEEGR
jgi:hypothetical protein